MIRSFGISAILILSAQASAGETLTGGEFYEDRSGYPCFTTLHTDAEKSVTLQLSDYKDVWSLKFIISDRASVYRRFFDSQGLRDADAFKDAFGGVRIGERSFDFNDTSLIEVQRQDVDEKTAGIFSVDERHNVARALEAMDDDGIEIRDLVSLDGNVEALSQFRACSYAAMGLQEGERVETDFRAEYRMIFEGAFKSWITSMARAEHCLVAQFDDDAVSEVVAAATEAFYPGIMNFRKRSGYQEDLEGILPMAKLSGMIEARTEGCLMVGSLADVSRIPVDRAIEEAATLD
ncbi:hypothetical protein SAMN05421688_2086 [Poseidonocella pacifica]|uniref:Uncharacterized protein n=1 Tax=Poseidonocella pacifica TaxID=871651 RepID=A0A1I0XB25_9RHOB|nr:hypothetical protein [Poseidonocella pacifica]SFA98289.1 hypothetical protein SAMN05421688_2086 [Poseidonocella pacifica]